MECEYCGRHGETVDVIREFYMDDSNNYRYTGRETTVCDACFYNSHITVTFHEACGDLELLFDEF